MMTLEFFHKSYHEDNVSYNAVRQFNKNKYVAAVAVCTTISLILKVAVCYNCQIGVKILMPGSYLIKSGFLGVDLGHQYFSKLLYFK